jgi:hypothetical protein
VIVDVPPFANTSSLGYPIVAIKVVLPNEVIGIVTAFHEVETLSWTVYPPLRNTLIVPEAEAAMLNLTLVKLLVLTAGL